jgi:hypothetical protein
MPGEAYLFSGPFPRLFFVKKAVANSKSPEIFQGNFRRPKPKRWQFHKQRKDGIDA